MMSTLHVKAITKAKPQATDHTMEGELINFIFVWLCAIAALCYCHATSKLTRFGHTRLFCILPVVGLFLFLPLKLTTISLTSLSFLFLTWLANFKLLLFAFGKGPLCSDPPLTLPRFLAIASLPIKPQTPSNYTQEKLEKKGLKSPLNYGVKCLLMASFVPLYDKEWIHPKMILLMYAIHVYVSLELSLAITGVAAQTFTGITLEPQFNEPYLSTSLQDFWGRRWNLMVTSILHPTIYEPVQSLSAQWLGHKWAALPATFSAFLISGLMHEILLYQLGKKISNWVMMFFFLLHGASLSVEIGLKKASRIRLPKVVSCLLTITFVVVTGLWLFIPGLMDCDAVPKARRETMALIQFMKRFWEIASFVSTRT